mmetsp:Transcript_5606/g.13164  ORF Transcript_5606/g.13164 Transcript_5606/m.13164 type:complete len:517 (+) Transcript_5606:156-1706(+)|eukprot:CAMPEP_0206488464 /NCGR_PEP_ID=MMETSP0324_2-20121206/42435_1 /ASSEMBLY_ACC=CAM_ASM_000836 /TAXON_ID=2866 /ORGANISM="Crypthecodinium cohnii, Strain Seligo" /LENGTH=516 /DNA_ID=CAMNT_0053967507 /DNA_START=87 /DNA_END=1637 /DNA_ORIENTATION=-
MDLRGSLNLCSGFGRTAGCHCCIPPELDIDPVPLPPHLSRKQELGFRRTGAAAALASASSSSSSSSSCSPATLLNALTPTPCANSNDIGSKELGKQQDGTQTRRDVVARGLSRFEIGIKAPSQPDWEQVSDRVVCILGQNPSHYTLNGTNCYLIGTGSYRLLIDCGEKFYGGAEFMQNLDQCMQEHGVKGLSGILVTHMHFDHYGNIDRLCERYGRVPVYTYDVADDEQFSLVNEVRRRGLDRYFLNDTGGPKHAAKVGEPIDGPSVFEGVDITWADNMVRHFPGDNLENKVKYLYFFQWHGMDLMERLKRGDLNWTRVEDGDVIRTDGATLVAMHTPGHAGDHISFLLEEEHSLFSGDHVLGWGTTLVLDMRDYMQTLRRMLLLHPNRLYPGHGALIEDGEDLLTRYIEHREAREIQAWEALVLYDAPAPLEDLAHDLYPDLPSEKLWMAKDNVEKLMRKFAGDKSAIAVTEDGMPYDLPDNYIVRRLPPNVRWAARRSIVPTPMKKGSQQHAKL